MLAQRLPGVLPAMDEDEAIEAAAVASIEGRFDLAGFLRQTFSFAAPLRPRRRRGGRRRGAAPGRDLARAPRACRSSTSCPSSTAVCSSPLRETARDRHRHGVAPGAPNSPPAPARRGNESLSPAAISGDPRRACRYARAGGALPRAAVRPLLDRIDLTVEVPAIAPEVLLESPPGALQRGARAGRRRARAAGNASGLSERPPAGRRGGAPLSPLIRAAKPCCARRCSGSTRRRGRIIVSLRVARMLADLAGASRPGQPRWPRDPVPAQPRLPLNDLRPVRRRSRTTTPGVRPKAYMIRPLTHARLPSLLAALSPIGPFAIDAYLPAFPAIAAAPARASWRCSRTLTIYMVAALASMVLWHGALADRFAPPCWSR